MSYNIDHVETPILAAWLTAANIVMLAKKCHKDLPPANFISDHVGAADVAMEEGHPERQIPLKSLYWCHDWSGHSYDDVLVKVIAPHVMGRVDAIFTWEGGHSSALRIVDGNVTKCDLVQTIVAPAKPGEDDLDTPAGIRAALLKMAKTPREPGKHEGNSFLEGWTASLTEFAARLPK